MIFDVGIELGFSATDCSLLIIETEVYLKPAVFSCVQVASNLCPLPTAQPTAQWDKGHPPPSHASFKDLAAAGDNGHPSFPPLLWRHLSPSLIPPSTLRSRPEKTTSLPRPPACLAASETMHCSHWNPASSVCPTATPYTSVLTYCEHVYTRTLDRDRAPTVVVFLV